MANSILDDNYEFLYYTNNYVNKDLIISSDFNNSGFAYIYPYLVSGAMFGNTANRNNVFYELLVVSIVLLLISLLTNLFGQKQLFRHFQNLSSVVKNNGISRKHLTRLNFVISVIPPLFCLIISLISYFSIFISLSNYTLYIFGFQNDYTIANECLYFQSNIDSYKNINSIISFYQGSFVSLILLFVLFLFFFAIPYFKNYTTITNENFKSKLNNR